MRKFIFAVCLLVASCASLEEESPKITGFNEESLAKVTISASNAIDTKTTLVRDGNTSHYSVKFKPTDQLAVFGGSSEPGRFVISGEVSDYSVVNFEGELEDGFKGEPIALYPYNEEASMENGKIKTTLPYLQNAVKNDFSSDSNLSVGICKPDSESPGHFSLELKNVCAIVKFSLPESVSVSKAVFKANGGESISGDILVTPGDEPSFSVVDGKDYIELAGNGMKSAAYYIPVLPGTLTKGFNIKLYCDGLDRPFAEISSDRSVELKRSFILNLGELSCTNEGIFAGSGTDEDPYIITSYTQMRRMERLINEGMDLGQIDEYHNDEVREKYRKASYYLAADIDCGQNIIGIGYTHIYGNAIIVKQTIRFQGHFNGGHHCISNYILDNGSDLSLGLFRYVQGAKIENLIVSPYQVRTLNENGAEQIGFLVGHVYSETGLEVTEITNCKTTTVGSTIMNNYPCKTTLKVPVGGMVGKCMGNLKIKNCTNGANLEVYEDDFQDPYLEVSIGGMVGLVCGTDTTPCTTEIDLCRNTGKIRKVYNDYDYGKIVEEWEANGGGMIGEVEDCNKYDPSVRITNCVNNGNVYLKCWRTDPMFGQDHFAGGMIGLCDSDGGDDPYIFNCLNTGDIYAYGNDAACGGMVGYNFSGDTHISLCVNTGSITGGGDTSDALGAISGQSHTLYKRADCTECYWTNDPHMYSTGDGSCTHCWYYEQFLGSNTPLTGEFLNGRKSVVNSNSSADAKIWSDTQWAASAKWVGESSYGGSCTLDIPEAGYTVL